MSVGKNSSEMEAINDDLLAAMIESIVRVYQLLIRGKKPIHTILLNHYYLLFDRFTKFIWLLAHIKLIKVNRN